MQPCLVPFLEWILGRHARDGGVTEIRVLTTDRGTWATLAGPDDLDALVTALTSGPHPRIGDANVYFGLQPARRPEQHRFGFRRVHRATRDADVHAYSLFAVDVDPEREPKGRSATDAEKAEARAVADRVREWLDGQGVDSLLADSGNGWHVLVPLVPAHGNDIAQAARDARTLLRWLDARFSTPTAKVDTSTFNPSRILKLYGSLAMKGADTPETPHRWSSIDLSVIPEDTDLFARLAAETRVLALPTPKRSSAWDGWRKEALAALPLEAVTASGSPGACPARGGSSAATRSRRAGTSAPPPGWRTAPARPSAARSTASGRATPTTCSGSWCGSAARRTSGRRARSWGRSPACRRPTARPIGGRTCGSRGPPPTPTAATSSCGRRWTRSSPSPAPSRPRR